MLPMIQFLSMADMNKSMDVNAESATLQLNQKLTTTDPSGQPSTQHFYMIQCNLEGSEQPCFFLEAASDSRIIVQTGSSNSMIVGYR